MRDFTHVANFPEYMSKVERFILSKAKPEHALLDMPAGNGLFAEKLRNAGLNITCGDFNSERPNYTYVNMEEPLPFDDQSFDFVTCMEGIEHVINPDQLVRELSRITKKGGYVIVTMPNVQNIYSRLKFLLTGIFYQFEPEFSRHPMGQPIDRGHISSLTYTQLNYLFTENNLQPSHIDGDKIKKKILLPLYLLIAAVNLFFYFIKIRKNKLELPYQLMQNTRFLMSRSLIASWKK